MKRVFKKNQIIITTLAIMIAIAGYLNFSGSKWTLGTEDLVETGIQSTEEDAQEDTALLDLSEEDLYTSNDIFTDEEPEDVS